MTYPTIRHYQEVLSLPPGDRPLKSPDLDEVNNGEILRPGRNIGFLHWGTGSFAIVFRCRKTDGRDMAVRCLLGPPVRDIAKRSQELNSYLQTLDPALPFFVEGKFVTEAIKVQDNWFPLFVMDWVAGSTLGLHVSKLVKDQDQKALSCLAGNWRQMVLDLQDARIAHGDLQPNNVMVVTDGELRLVDYDTIFVPPLAGRPCSALGVPGYVHPSFVKKSNRPFHAEMDTFGAVVIYLSLLALAHDPSLHQKFSRENLFFSDSDLATSSNSPAFKALLHSGDPTIVPLAEKLCDLCKCALSDAPLTFQSVLESSPEELALLLPEHLVEEYAGEQSNLEQNEFSLPETEDGETSDDAMIEQIGPETDAADDVFSEKGTLHEWPDADAARQISMQLLATAFWVGLVVAVALVLLKNLVAP